MSCCRQVRDELGGLTRRSAMCRLSCPGGAGLIGRAPGTSLLKEWLGVWSRCPLLAHTQV